MTDSNLTHYDPEYFAARYGRVATDPTYRSLLSDFWNYSITRPAKAMGIPEAARLLDFGAGTGVVSAAMPDTACFDPAPWAQAFLRSTGRETITDLAELDAFRFDAVLCSHSLEHHDQPLQTLLNFHRWVRPGGSLLLLLPIERDFRATTEPDVDQHLYAWTFQSISNLLRRADWTPIHAETLFGPMGLGLFGRHVAKTRAVRWSYYLGRFRRGFPSMFVIAKSGN